MAEKNSSVNIQYDSIKHDVENVIERFQITGKDIIYLKKKVIVT